MRIKILPQLLSAALVIGLTTTRLVAGTFTANFNDGLVPAGTSVAGTAVVEADGGVGGTGALKLTKAVNDQNGSFIIEDLDPGSTDGVNSLTVDFKVRVGGGTTTPADGWSFCAAPDLTSPLGGEEGMGSGLIISFDTYDNTDGNPDNNAGEAPAIDVRLGTTTVASTLYPNAAFLRTGSDYADVHIRVDEDGTLDLVFKGTVVYTNLNLAAFGFRPVAAVKYGFGGRTGGLNDNHWIDDLNITTTTGPLRLAFTRPLRSVTAVEGSAITLRSQVNDPTAVIQYQWQRKGPSDAAFADIAGATAASYTTSALTLADSGTQFRVNAVGANNDAQSDVATVTVVSLPLPAAETTFNFDDGAVPAGTAVYGTAIVTPTGGVADSGAVRLTEALNDQNGSFIIEDQDAGGAIGSMTATFDLQLGPGTALPADGFSFNWANNLPSGVFNPAEEGAGTGLTVSFDVWDNGGGEAPAIEIKWQGATVATKKFTVEDLSIGTFAKVVVRLERDGTVDVAYAGELVHSNVQVSGFSGLAGARFGFGARTGGANEVHLVDNITLATAACTDCQLLFVRQPEDTAVLVNGTATFTAEVNTPTAATYQWQRKGPSDASFANVAGATSASYTTPPLAAADNQAQYRLIVTGSLNTITSRAATVSVINLARPTTDLDIDINFNDGLTPPDSQISGTAMITATGGVGDSGVLHLTDAANDQNGAFLITKQLEGGRAVDRFVAAFAARVDGGTPQPADGYSFNWAADLPPGVYGTAEEGAGSGLTVSFDVWDSGGGEAPAITLKWQGNTVTNRNVPLDVIRTPDGTFEDVLVSLDPDGTVDLVYGGQVILYNVALPNFVGIPNAQFGFAGRTGGANENHWIDNIAIQTFQSTAPPAISQQPGDRTLLAGSTATLSVRVSDPLAVSGYQWQQKAPGAANFSNIAGATTEDFTTPALSVADNGIQYRALISVTSPSVTLTSRVATITVIEIPIPTPTVSYDFNDGALPAGAAVFGNAMVDTTGGFEDSGAIKLTVNVNSQVGSLIVNDIASGNRVCSMTAAFKVLVGGGTTPPADGMSFVWADDLADGAFGEDGAGSGLVISFDTYDNVDGDPNNGTGEAPAIEVRYRGESLGTNKVTTALLNTDGQFVDVIVRVESDGTVDVAYDNQIIFNNLQLPNYTGQVGARFGWGARTGGLNDNHWLDNIQLAVGSSCPPRLSITRSGANVVVTFTGGVLETATTITGPWTPLAGQTSPYTAPTTDPARFFRARTP